VPTESSRSQTTERTPLVDTVTLRCQLAWPGQQAGQSKSSSHVPSLHAYMHVRMLGATVCDTTTAGVGAEVAVPHQESNGSSSAVDAGLRVTATQSPDPEHWQ